MGLNKKSVDDINAKGKRVLVRCDFNVPLKNGEITDETRIVAALPTINKLVQDGGKVILCSHLGKVKNGPNEGESLAPVAKRLSEKLGKEVKFIADPIWLMCRFTPFSKGHSGERGQSRWGTGAVHILQGPRPHWPSG